MVTRIRSGSPTDWPTAASTSLVALNCSLTSARSRDRRAISTEATCACGSWSATGPPRAALGGDSCRVCSRSTPDGKAHGGTEGGPGPALQQRREHLRRTLRVVPADVEVSEQAHAAGADGADTHALLGCCRDQVRRGGHVDDDDVRVHGGRVDAARLGDQPGVLVVLGHPLEVMVDGVQTGRGEHTDLAHAAAHPLAPYAGLVDLVLRAHEERPDRGTEPLGQADRERVRARAVRLKRGAGGDVRVPDPG